MDRAKLGSPFPETYLLHIYQIPNVQPTIIFKKEKIFSPTHNVLKRNSPKSGNKTKINRTKKFAPLAPKPSTEVTMKSSRLNI